MLTLEQGDKKECMTPSIEKSISQQTPSSHWINLSDPSLTSIFQFLQWLTQMTWGSTLKSQCD